MDFRELIEDYAEQPITRQVLFDALKGYKRPYDKISELINQQLLVPVKRGVYVPGQKLRIQMPEPFLLANHLAGPSYVSLETALSHWGLIPERVFEISSMTMGKTVLYTTVIGRFSYTHIPAPYYPFGIKPVSLTKKQVALVGMPEKALCDKIVTTPGVLLRSIRQTERFLMEDMRIEKEALRNLDHARIRSWITASPKKDSLNILVKTLQTL